MSRLFEKEIDRRVVVQGLLVLIYKVILDYSFAYYLIPFDSGTYNDGFDGIKYCNAWIAVGLIYLCINRLQRNDVAQLMLNIMNIVSFIPLSTVYAFEGFDALCFNMVFFSFGAVAIIVDGIMPKGLRIQEFDRLRSSSVAYRISVMTSAILIVVLFGFVYIENGFPRLNALDFSQIYKTVRADLFLENKYARYLYKLVVLIVAPYLVAVFHEKKMYGGVAVLSCALFLLFLYSGDKTTLFSIGVFLGIIFISKCSPHDSSLISILASGFSAVCLSWVATGKYIIYSYLVRRVLFVPAHLKFVHYEYFLNNEKLGLSGTVLNKMLGLSQYNSSGRLFDESYTSAIGRMIGKPGTACNTGVLIEGFDRFGLVGFLIMGLLVVLLLLALRRFENYTTHSVAVLSTAYFFYSLNDSFLLGSDEFAFMTIMALSLLVGLPQEDETGWIEKRLRSRN